MLATGALCHMFVHMAVLVPDRASFPPILLRQPLRYPGTFYLNCMSLLSGQHLPASPPNPPKHMKQWSSYIGVINGTFSHAYVYISGLPHLAPYLETTAICIMTHHLMGLPVALNCNDCLVTYWTTIIAV